MVKEYIATGKTVEAAVEAGAEALGVGVSDVSYEIIEEPSRGFFGLGATEARVKVCYEPGNAQNAKEFVERVINGMGMSAQVTADEDDERVSIKVNGENMGVLIGRHGEVLDALQYLTGFAVNRNNGEEYVRVQVDVENYRAKRDESLRALAHRTAEKVRKYRRSFTLEPMSSYERRIIHAEAQGIKGITTYSIGQGTERRVVIASEKSVPGYGDNVRGRNGGR